MPHTGVALMVVVGVGLGAFLYYVFAGNQHQHGHESGGYSSPPPSNHDSWSPSQDDNRTRRRKRGSSVSTGRASCTICLAELGDKELLQLRPCGHDFHKACIAKWREQGPLEARNTCPNCREAIFGSSTWD